MKRWELMIFCADSWFFSTKEMAEKAIKYFRLKTDEYALTEVDATDDKELLERINNLSEDERKKLGL